MTRSVPTGGSASPKTRGEPLQAVAIPRRSRRWLLFAVLVATIVAGCGDDGDGVELITRAEAPAIVNRALLTPDDLGEGWVEAPPDKVTTDRAEGAIEFDRCLLGGDFERTILAQSEPHAFVPADSTSSGEGSASNALSDPLQVVSQIKFVAYGSAVIDTPERVDKMFGAIDSKAAERCIVDAAGESESGKGAEVTIERDVVQAERSARLTLSTGQPPLSFEVNVVVIARGQVLTFLAAMDFGGGIDGRDVMRWAELMAGRLSTE